MMYLLIGTDIIGILEGLPRDYNIKNIFYYIYIHTRHSQYISNTFMCRKICFISFLFIIFFLFLIRGNEFNITQFPYLRCLLAIHLHPTTYLPGFKSEGISIKSTIAGFLMFLIMVVIFSYVVGIPNMFHCKLFAVNVRTTFMFCRKKIKLRLPRFCIGFSSIHYQLYCPIGNTMCITLNHNHCPNVVFTIGSGTSMVF